MAELGESLHSLLAGLEQLGVEALPPELEQEMRRAMSMSPSIQDSDLIHHSCTYACIYVNIFGRFFSLN